MHIALLVWVAIATILSYIIERLWSDIASRRAFRVAMAPGVIVHEVSHVVACWLVGAKVSRVQLFGASGGSVTHAKPRLPVMGQPIISLAPVAGCTLALWCVWWFFSGRLGLEFSNLPQIDLTAAGGKALWQTLNTLFADSLKQVFTRKFLSAEGAIFIYLVLTFSICMAPSFQDLRHALLGLVVIGAIVFLINRTGFANFQLAEEWSNKATSFGWKAFTFTVLLLMSALAVSLPALIIRKVLSAK